MLLQIAVGLASHFRNLFGGTVAEVCQYWFVICTVAVNLGGNFLGEAFAYHNAICYLGVVIKAVVVLHLGLVLANNLSLGTTHDLQEPLWLRSLAPRILQDMLHVGQAPSHSYKPVIFCFSV